jgi:predicted ATPase
MDAHPLATGPAAAKLVGRDAELAALNQALDALNIPTSRVVQVAGEPGMGKTRLLAELCA